MRYDVGPSGSRLLFYRPNYSKQSMAFTMG